MNIQQLQYVVAVHTFKNFVHAAEHCYVTQATLSMMIKKLEQELGVILFDRHKQPIITTDIGERVVKQARSILTEIEQLRQLVREEKSIVEGELKIGIIPTLAPYLLPIFLNSFMQKYPEVRVKINEMLTNEILDQLEIGQLDVGILAIPLHQKNFYERFLFEEEFVVYASSKEKLLSKKYVLAQDIDVSRLWLLEEGHCLRNQVINLCELKVKERDVHQLDFTAASIETIKKIVELNNGITVLPALAVKDLTKKQQKNVRQFKSPAPKREIGLITHRYFLKSKLIELLEKEIVDRIND